MKARKQKGGIPAGRAALKAVAKEEVSKGKAVDRLADWLGSAALVKKDFRGRPVPSSFLEEVAALVAAGMPHTPSSLKAQAEKHEISLPDLVAAIRGKDVERLRRILARPNACADEAMEEVFEADDQEVKAKIEKFYKDHPEWSHDKPDEISLKVNGWQKTPARRQSRERFFAGGRHGKRRLMRRGPLRL